MRYFYLTVLVLYLSFIHASVFTNFRDNVLSKFDGERRGGKDDIWQNAKGSMNILQSLKQKNAKDKKSAQDKAKVLQKVRAHEINMNTGRDLPHSKLSEIIDKRLGKEYYHMDPVLNELRRVFEAEPSRKNNDDDRDSSSSSEKDISFWKADFNGQWMEKKFEALNSTLQRGDVVNMVAARPWGVSCGDPNQHDIPWGSCMLPDKCESEYRIYRGDYFCGRTKYVCCSLQYTNDDLYQGLDGDSEESGLSTDSSDEKSELTREKKRAHERKKRKRERNKRKKKIKRTIKKIVKEMERILNKAYRNGTTMRKKKTRELRKFIKLMKSQFVKDRKAVLQIHEHEMTQLDEKLQKKLDQVKGLNHIFFNNATFRDILINGTAKEKLKEFLRTHPKLRKILAQRRQDGGLIEPVLEDAKSEDLQYDIEYGVLYY